MATKNAFYAQSGGVSAVINASACGVLETARQHRGEIGKVYAGRNGIIGALTEDLIDTSLESEDAIAALKHTPGAAFGSCRYKLKSMHKQGAEYERLLEVFRAHDIGFFFYNGGGDSQDAAFKVSQIGAEQVYPIVGIGIPKTVDNDLPITDCSPGFGSMAKYIATSLREAAFDLAAMSRTSTKVFALEVMGRHAGWATAACALAAEREGDAPHVLLLPEVTFNEDRFVAKVERALELYDHCVIAVSEGVKKDDGKFLSASGLRDAFGHSQLGGVAPVIYEADHREARLPVSLGRSRLPATIGAAHCFQDRCRTGLRRRPSGGGIRRCRTECSDAGDTPAQRFPLSLGHRRGTALSGRQPREASARRVHQRRRLRHHRGCTPLSGAAYRWRGLSAVQGWSARLCDAAEYGGAEEARWGVRTLKAMTTE
jgi:6-phosphofructokinase